MNVPPLAVVPPANAQDCPRVTKAHKWMDFVPDRTLEILYAEVDSSKHEQLSDAIWEEIQKRQRLGIVISGEIGGDNSLKRQH